MGRVSECRLLCPPHHFLEAEDHGGVPVGLIRCAHFTAQLLNFCFPDAAIIHDLHEEKMENGQSAADGFLLKSAPGEFMNVAEDGLISNQLDSLSDDFTGLRKDGFIHKPSNHLFLGGDKSCGLSVDDRKIAMASALETVPNSMQITPAMAQGINADIKHQLMKEVRKFGRSK